MMLVVQISDVSKAGFILTFHHVVFFYRVPYTYELLYLIIIRKPSIQP